MTANWEVFAKDPRQWEIPNEGVTEVVFPQTDDEFAVLQWELESFVCDGEYANGLTRMLSGYLGRLSQHKQTAVWVSGFYGSGKSHLTRMLAELWLNREMPDGRHARDIANLSTGVTDEFRELDTAARQSGGVWSAAGKLGSGTKESFRLAFLSILFESAGLPSTYPAARLALKLAIDGVYEEVVSSLEANGKNARAEFLQLYVSTPLHEAVLAALPGIATDVAELRNLLTESFPNVTDISDGELETVMRMVLELQSGEPGVVPHTVIILDEVQVYIADNTDRLADVQNIAEMVASSFDSKVLMVATGQSALAGSPILSKMQARFPTKVALSDKDVEQVTRKLVLFKKAEEVAGLDAALDAVTGEITKHLSGSKIGHRATDRTDWTLDYPILPTRQRLWEKMLRQIDSSGGAGQLRTQLRMMHEANQSIADNQVPTVVGADFIYFDQEPGMLSASILSLEMRERILSLDDGTPEGELAQRVMAMVFMLSQLPREAGADIEVRSTIDTIAHLLVTDLEKGSGQLSHDVNKAVEDLVADGALVEVEGEYALQTPAGAELWRKFEEKKTAMAGSSPQVSDARNVTMKAAIDSELAGLTKSQGVSQVPRKLDVMFGGDQPDSTSGKIPIWIQTEWSTSPKAVETAAQLAGVDDPTIFVVLPKEQGVTLDAAVVRAKAAEHVLSTEPAATTPEAEEARRALQTELAAAETEARKVSGEVVARARILQGGGTELAGEGSLRTRVVDALDASLARMYPRFSDGDHKQWHKVADRARDGSQNAFEAVDHATDPSEHPVAKAILQFTPDWQTGADVRAQFTAGEYGWPRDAIDGALLGLVADGHLKATDSKHKPVVAPSIRTTDIPSTRFLRETVVLTHEQKLSARSILQDLGISTDTSTINDGIGQLIGAIDSTAIQVKGGAPLPERADVGAIAGLRSKSGNEAILLLLSDADAVAACHADLSQRAAVVGERRRQWDLLLRLSDHADGTDLVEEHVAAIEAIRTDRQLLVTPDPAAPALAALVVQLGGRVEEQRQVLVDLVESAVERIKATPEWTAADPESRRVALATAGLAAPDGQLIADAEALVKALDSIPLSSWATMIEAVSVRETKALHEIAKLAEPDVTVVAVTLPGRVLKTQADVDGYLDELGAILGSHMEKGSHVSL